MLMEDLVGCVKNDQMVIMVNNEKLLKEQLETKGSITASKASVLFRTLENLSLALNSGGKEVDNDERDEEPVAKQAKIDLQPSDGIELI
jgi:hypothetical protein